MDLDLAIWQISPGAQYRMSVDKTTIIEWRGPGLQPTQAQLDAAWTQVQATQATVAAWLAIQAQHKTALATIKAAITANSTTTGNDITALSTIVTAMQAGTPPTNAQLLQVLRFLVRALVALNS